MIDLEVDARVLEAAEHLEHAADRVARGRGRPGDLGRTIWPATRAAVVARRDEELVQHAPVEGDHVAAEAPVVLVAADHALEGALEHADDAALGPLGVWRSTRATTRSPCSASFMFTAAT